MLRHEIDKQPTSTVHHVLTVTLVFFETSRWISNWIVTVKLNLVYCIHDFCDDFFETLHHDILGIEGASPPWALNMCCSLYPVLRRPQLEVVGGSHAHTVGTCVMNNQSSSLKGQYMSEGNRGDTNHQIKYNGFEKRPHKGLEVPYLFQGNLRTHKLVQQYRRSLLRHQEWGERPVRYAATWVTRFKSWNNFLHMTFLFNEKWNLNINASSSCCNHSASLSCCNPWVMHSWLSARLKENQQWKQQS